MKSTKKIVLDLLGGTIPPSIKAKQNDKNSRYVEASLYSGSEIFTPDTGALFAFRYKKPDGTAGFYDSLPDNTPAIVVSGNIVTIELVEQVLTISGNVSCELNIYNATGGKLTTFTFSIIVEKSVLADSTIISSDYYNVLTTQIASALQYKNEAAASAAAAASSAAEAAATLASTVKSVNNKTPNSSGSVILISSDIGALATDGNGSNVTAAFAEAAQDSDIVSGETLSTLLGKIKKRLSLLKSIASNRSELDNDYFLHSVNQRGISDTISTAGYFIDRWKLVSGSVTLSTDGIQLAAGTVIAQILEYAAGTEVIASLGTTSGTAAAVYDDASKTYTITATTACTLTWAKLEKGSIATPYVPKGYGAELAECQRYYLRVPAWQMIGSGYVQYDGALIAVMIPTPCTMRTNPSINSISGTLYFGDGTTSSYTGTPGVVSRPGWAAISFTGTFGHQNQTVAFLLSGSTVELSADL